jgi:DNA polymerase III subunit alpha
MDFAHLHVHTEYSINDATAKIEPLIKRVKELGMTSVAITDHGNLFGIYEFYKAAKKEGVKPIIGCEAYVCPQGKEIKVRENRHIVLLAKNDIGFKNLIAIMSDAAENGFYYNARTDYETLKKHGEGLICLTACLGGDVPVTLKHDGFEKAEEKIVMFKNIFDDVFIELQDNKIADQYVMNELLIELAHRTNTPLVATNDIHYVYSDGHRAHDLLMAIQAGVPVTSDKRKVYGTDDLYVKSGDEMNTGRLPLEALENTVKIAEMCNVEIEFGNYHIPVFTCPSEYSSSEEYLRKLAYDGLKVRYGDGITSVHTDRLEYELGVVIRMGYIDYFLITWDFVDYAANVCKAMLSPGRGSAAGSILSYCLKITNIEPLGLGLLFERFLNPDRISMPDQLVV